MKQFKKYFCIKLTILDTSFFLVLLFILPVKVTSQVKIGNNPSVIQSSSLLELESTNKGLVLPRIQLIDTANSSPLPTHLAGMTIYNITQNGLLSSGIFHNDGQKWVRIARANGDIMLIKNGLTNFSSTAHWGGALTQKTTISGLTTSNYNRFYGSGNNAFRIDTSSLNFDFQNRRIGLGTITPLFTFHNQSNDQNSFAVDLNSSLIDNSAIFMLRKNNSDISTILNPILNSNPLGRISFSGVNTSTSYVPPGNASGFRINASSDFSNTSASNQFTFFTTPTLTLAAQPRMVIKDNGYIGIGVTSINNIITPVHLLHLHQAATNMAGMIRMSNYDFGYGATNGFEFGLDVASIPKIWHLENNSISILTNNVFRLFVTETGNVKIGTSPTTTHKLDVDGSINISSNNTLHYENKNDFRLVIREDYQTAVTGWTNNTRTTIGGAQILGGYNVLAGTSIQKTFDLTGIPHTEVMIKFTYCSIDSWDGETAYANILNTGGQWILKSVFLNDPGRVNLGGNGVATHMEGFIAGKMSSKHTANSITIRFGSTLDQAPSDESFGIDNLEIWVR